MPTNVNQPGAATVHVIIEGGLVRDVVGAANYNVVDLDLLDGGGVEEAQELEYAVDCLPDDYSDRSELEAMVADWIASLRESEGG